MNALRRLLIILTIATYVLVSVGGLVRAMGAGLGCPDWPLCFGRLIPPMSLEGVPDDPAHPEWKTSFNPKLAWTEYLNRLYGIAVGLLAIAVLIIAARRRLELPPRLLGTLIAILLLFIAQGGLGGLVVLAHLDGFKITIHFLAAIGIVLVLLYANVLSFAPKLALWRGDLPRSRRIAQWVMRGLIALVMAQVFMGTRVRTAIDEAFGKGKAPDEAASGVARSEWLEALNGFDVPHRQLGVLTLLLVLVGLSYALRVAKGDRALCWTLAMTAFAAFAQVLSGVVLAYAGFPAWSMVAHLSLSTWLVGGLFLADLLLVRTTAKAAAATP